MQAKASVYTSSGKVLMSPTNKSAYLITSLQPNFLDKVRGEQNAVHQYVDDIKEAVEETIQRREIILKGRYFHVYQLLSDTKKVYENRKKHLATLERKLEGQPSLQSYKQEIHFYNQYSSKLSEDSEVARNQIIQQQQYHESLKGKIKETREKLRKLNFINLQLASEINDHKVQEQRFGSVHNEKILPIDNIQKNYLLPSEIISPPMSSSSIKRVSTAATRSLTISRGGQKSQENYLQRPFTNQGKRNNRQNINFEQNLNDPYFIKRELNLVSKNVQDIRSKIIHKIGNFNKLYDLFLQGFHKLEEELMKSQAQVKNEGLNGSLIFMLLTAKKHNLNHFNPTTLKDIKLLKASSNETHGKKQMEGETVDIIYDTFKGMIQKEWKKETYVREMIKSVSPEQMQEFTAIQVIGLVLLKSDTIKEIIKEFEGKRIKLHRLHQTLKRGIVVKQQS